MLSNLREQFSRHAGQFGAYLVFIVVGIISLSMFFSGGEPARWLALTLLLTLIAFELISNRYLWKLKVAWMPHVVMTTKLAIIVTLMLLPPRNGIFVLLFYVLAVEAPLMFKQWTWIAWVTALAIIAAIVLIIQDGWSAGATQGLLYGAGFYFFASFALTTRRAEEAQEESQRLLLRLQSAHEQLQAYADQVEELTIVEERNRLAREMHDTVGHRLTVSAVQLEAAQRLISTDPGRATDMVGTVHGQVQEALGELRQTVAALRAPVEEDLSLATSLQRLVQQFQQGTGIQVRLALPDSVPDLPPSHRKALYRAAQETLTNVQRHAGAKQVWMELQHRDDSVALHVGDDGVGVPPHMESDGFGLRGLRERAVQLGGDFHLAPRPGGGSQATFHVPLG